MKTPETRIADAIDEMFANFMYEEKVDKRNSPKEPEFRTNATSPKLAVTEITKGSPVAPIAVLPSKERQRLQNYTEYLRNLMPEDFDVEYRQDHIRVSLPYFDKNKNHQDDFTPHQRQLPEQTEESKFNYTPHIASILEYCVAKGMKVTPIPEVKIRHDEENAGNLFGRTGYYQPDTQEIVLYVTNRHPKDVLRSFCHELIHHMQNLEGRDLTFYTTDVHADENLKAIEQEAHAKGSFLFRDWENSNKEQTHINEAAILESLTTPEKEDLVRQVLRLAKIHGDDIEKIANRLSMPKSLGRKIGGVGKSFGKRFVEAVLKEIAVNRTGTYYPEDTSDISLVLERLRKLYKEDEGESTEERI